MSSSRLLNNPKLKVKTKKEKEKKETMVKMG
jgi:hypothetical protein